MNSNKNRLENEGHWTRIPLCGLLGLFLWASPDADANWHISPELGAGVQYDDKTRLNNAPGLSESETSYAIDALAVFFYDQQLTDIKITPRLRSRKFSGNSDLDSNDQFLNLDLSHNRQKSDWLISGRFSSESVRTAEQSDVDFDIEDPDEISADDTARVFETGKRDRLLITPKFSYDISQRMSLDIIGEYLDTSYDDDVSLIGFSEYSIGAYLNYSWSEKDTISFGGDTGKFEQDVTAFDATNNTIGVGYNRRLSERTQFRTLIGSSSSEDQNGDDQSNAVGEISIIHRYLTTRAIVSYRRQTSGSGSGGLGLRDSFSLNLSRDLSPKITLQGGIRAYRTEALDSSNVGFEERDYLQIRATARWRLSRIVSVSLDYRYTDIGRDVAGIGSNDNDFNQIGVWVRWHPNPLPE